MFNLRSDMPFLTPAGTAKAGLTRALFLAYESDQLDLGHTALLAQNIYEAGLLPKLPPRYYLMVDHYARMGLIHVAGRPFH